MAWRVVEWFWVAKCNHNCWNSVAESFVKASYFARTRHAHQVTAKALHILHPSFLTCSLSLIMLSAPNSDKHRMEIEQPQFKYWALVLDFQLCVLRLVRRIRCGDYRPWNVRLNVCPGILLWTMWTMRCKTFSSLSFFWSICCVETKIEKKALRPLSTYPKLRTLSMNGFAVLANKCAEENANVPRQLVVHSPVRMRLGRVSWLERGSSANELIVFNTVHN